MERRSDGIVYFALIVAVIALILGGLAYARRPASPVSVPGRPPATLKLSMVVATFTGPGMAAHRWYPTMLVAREGDTIDLAVANPDTVNHQLEITGYNLKTKVLTPGSSEDLRFIADQTGVFAYQCVLPYDPAKHNCTPDHELMRGYLIVTK